ncbi:hypothetical protein Glove_397g17 [Diversispora epigaea]|uniref:GH18 domain-containing protein n=1 Tax=Diversispora epigaea TaxID=1348612 RepID=A0A397H0P6_9GLOM|nr:hypothetical protein Glove_397g17 [Diversispora epigaea]
MKRYLFLSIYEFLLYLSYVLLLIVGKNEIFASFSYKVDNVEYIKRDTAGDNNACSSLDFSDVLMGKNEIFASFSYKVDNVEYIKRDTAGDNNACSSLDFSDVLSKTKVFGFYDPLKPLENNYSVVDFIKDIRIDYLNYIVDINNFETNETIKQELNDLRNDTDLKGLQILLSITSSDLNNNLVNNNKVNNGASIEATNFNYSDSIKIIAEKVKNYGLDGVNIVKNDCNGSLSDTLDNIKIMRSSYSNKDWITTFTVNANDRETPLNNINSIQEHVNYTIIQAFYLNQDDNYSAPLYSNNSNIVTFDSLFNQLKGLNVSFTELIWGFDLSGIINPSSVNGSIKNNDKCLKNWDKISIWPWKEIRKTALTNMCKANDGWTRRFDNDTNSAILSGPQLDFAYEDPESLYHKFNWVTSNNFAGISIANLASDSIDSIDSNDYSILKFIKSKSPESNGSVKIPSNPINDNNKKNNKVIIGVVVGCILFAIGLFMIFFYCSRRRKRHSAIEVKVIEDKHPYSNQPAVVNPSSPKPSPPPSQRNSPTQKHATLPPPSSQQNSTSIVPPQHII